MKLVKNIGLCFIFIFVLLCFCCNPKNKQDYRVFGIFGSIGVVTDNKLKIYTYDGGWKEQKNLAFILPESYSNVFGIEFSGDMAIGVVVKEKLNIYTFGTKWKEQADMAFTLNNDYSGVFRIGYGSIGVVVNDQLKIFIYNNGTWEEQIIKEFELPKGYSDIFGIYEEDIGIVLNGKLKIYTFDLKWEEIDLEEFTLDDKWKEINLEDFTFYGNWEEVDLDEFSLPYNYSEIFGMEWIYIGVVANNRVKIYIYNDGWEELKGKDFKIKY